MARFRVNVCLDRVAAGDVDAALTAAMAPFDYNFSDEWNSAGE
ncbi:hypothetical protein GA0070611_1359 [Micromonospora auratinigra]|uniref:Uncharacterized protein n=1 Tax=Micromonospora auratinigra TaxID=261654 RepID=A0A1A8Z9T6_9ACTN|nr:hypothetical protein GA0070611_1359 [Micromonospora auratinigra]